MRPVLIKPFSSRSSPAGNQRVCVQIGNGLTGFISGVSPVTITMGARPALVIPALSNGATLAIDLADGDIFSNNVTNNGLLTTIASGTNTLSGVISGSGAFTQNGAGTTILTGANTYTGATTVLQGTLRSGELAEAFPET